MRFLALGIGETQQLNGPHFGVRVLVAGAGSSLIADSVALPVPACLPALDKVIDRVIATGPIIFVLGDEERDDLAKAAATPAAASSGRTLQVASVPPATYALSALLATFTRPLTADSFALIQFAGSRPASRLDFYYGAQSWKLNSAAVATVPAVYCCFNQSDGRNVAGPGYAVVALGSNLTAPDRIELRVNDVTGPFVCAVAMDLLGLWWASGSMP